ncbi:MAG: hydantoinase/oxoprolinase family protein [Propionibacteriaceae bacterium]|jgi:N-methylhydantoinase A/oxoprolinase/acetone carboxylase beta subunit|nr:hydantoinase/oxoprolinase family protein [Propionibacteriaceae bacterium]
MSIRIGIDVGGTSTDAVAVDAADRLVAHAKAATSPEPFDGIAQALDAVLAQVDASEVTHAMLGTTHLTNALLERRSLSRVGVLRLSAPAATQPRPGTGWPPELAAVIGPVAVVGGGCEYDGSLIAELDEKAVRTFAESCVGKVGAVSVTGVFSAAHPAQETRAAQIVSEIVGVPVSESHVVGGLSLIPRENATILNAAIISVARNVIDGFHQALHARGLSVESYLTQNDGTLMAAEAAIRFPLLTVNAAMANSMRGASRLSGLDDALVIDVGGTTADMGLLVDGFPKQRVRGTEVAGIPTNFPTPQISSFAFGGGTLVKTSPALAVGPQSVGYRVTQDALIGGGSRLTLSDVSAAAGRDVGFGDAALSAQIPAALVSEAMGWVDQQVRRLVERHQVPQGGLPLLAVGGGAHLVGSDIPGVSQVIRPPHSALANAYGAAIAEVSGSVDRVYNYDRFGREHCLDAAQEAAVDAAIQAGAKRGHVRVAAIKEVPLTYVTGQTCRVQVKATGPLRA